MSDLAPTMSAERAETLFAHLRDYRDEGERRGIPAIIKELHAGQGWKALNYDTWQEACEAELGGFRLGWVPEERREVVAELRDAGMSTRAIGTALGVGMTTVKRDLAGGPGGPPDPTPVTGLDGKTYTPQPRPVAPVIHIDPDEVPDDEVAEVTAHLEAFIDGSAEVRAARIRADFAKWIVQIGRTSMFDPEELAAITQLDSAENFDSAIDRLVRWHKAYQSARAVGSLRVIEGDMR